MCACLCFVLCKTRNPRAAGGIPPEVGRDLAEGRQGGRGPAADDSSRWDAEAGVDGSGTRGAEASGSGHHNAAPQSSALRGAVEVPRKTSVVPAGQP